MTKPAAAAPNKRLNPTGWGYKDDALTPDERKQLMRSVGMFFDNSVEPVPPPPPQDISLPKVKVAVPPPLRGFITTMFLDRLLHATGRSTRDLINLRSGELSAAPDAVAMPRDLNELERTLAWADAQRLAVIPFGGGSSVVGGINPENLGDVSGCITLDLKKMNRVHEIDSVSQVVHADGGILGPDLDAALKTEGLSSRHYPQSYFHSTLGGWAATRGAGHFSTQFAKIEDRVQALNVMLPNGERIETRPLPASSVGPDPARLWLGSEGALGVITSVRLRVVRVTENRASSTVSFDRFEDALGAARDMLQGGIFPTQLRILDPFENMMSNVLQGKPASGASMILSFEQEYVPVAAVLDSALAVCRDHNGVPDENKPTDGSGEWRDTFFRQPYIRDALLDYHIVSETFETAVPWTGVADRYAAIRKATLDAVMRICGRGGVNCRTTHAYPDGVSLYFSFFGQCSRGNEQTTLHAIKQAASDAVMLQGGTISHHHAMGRDHKPWAEKELPAAWRRAVRATRRELDPNGVMNPGLWFDD